MNKKGLAFFLITSMVLGLILLYFFAGPLIAGTFGDQVGTLGEISEGSTTDCDDDGATGLIADFCPCDPNLQDKSDKECGEPSEGAKEKCPIACKE